MSWNFRTCQDFLDDNTSINSSPVQNGPGHKYFCWAFPWSICFILHMMTLHVKSYWRLAHMGFRSISFWLVFLCYGEDLKVLMKFTGLLVAHLQNKGFYRVSAGLKFTSDILSKQPQYCSDIWKFFRTFINTHFYQHKWKLPSALLILKPGVILQPFRMVSAAWLIGWLFYLMRRQKLVDRWKWVGYCFLLLFATAAHLVSHGKWLFR